MTFYQRRGKRILDLFLGVVSLPLLGVSGLVSAPLIRRDGGPAVYRSTRLGLGLQEFTMLKFRSMAVDAADIRNADGTTFNAADDPRVTPIGALLRKTSVDELPQIINVLKGDMSFVGPRPSPTGNQDRYDALALRRFEVRPGITGLDQAINRNSSSLAERYANDARYVDTCSLRLDLWIILRTLVRVSSQKGVHRNG